MKLEDYGNHPDTALSSGVIVTGVLEESHAAKQGLAVDDLINTGKATVKVMRSTDKWYGVTYKEDKPVVEAAVRALVAAGEYPSERLLG